jgi:hypothetical protein
MTRSPHGLKPALQYRGLRFSRTAGEAFRTPEWASGFERHVPPPLWSRVVLFIRRRLA